MSSVTLRKHIYDKSKAMVINTEQVLIQLSILIVADCALFMI
jgi:hypothetical protein